MTGHLGAERYERSHRTGHRNGSFSTKLFQRYQRSEKALVLALMEMVVRGVSTRRVKKITTELCEREFGKSAVSRLTKQLDEQGKA